MSIKISKLDNLHQINICEGFFISEKNTTPIYILEE
jgi:hypothetical protein